MDHIYSFNQPSVVVALDNSLVKYCYVFTYVHLSLHVRASATCIREKRRELV